IVLLSDLLRRALDGTKEHEVSLAQELELLDCYLEIERTRFGDRLSIEMDVAPQTLTAQVPNLILQPIVENAIKHGLAASGAGRIEVRAEREQARLRIEVRDNGAGLTSQANANGASSKGREGLGLANTRARLERLYGAAHSLELANA